MLLPMSLFDVTRPLSPALPVYPGDPVIELTPIAQCAWGDGANVTRIVLSSHTGTHIDAPRHFLGSSQSRHLSGLTSLHIFRPSQGQPGLANLIITIE